MIWYTYVITIQSEKKVLPKRRFIIWCTWTISECIVKSWPISRFESPCATGMVVPCKVLLFRYNDFPIYVLLNTIVLCMLCTIQYFNHLIRKEKADSMPIQFNLCIFFVIVTFCFLLVLLLLISFGLWLSQFLKFFIRTWDLFMTYVHGSIQQRGIRLFNLICRLHTWAESINFLIEISLALTYINERY